MNDIQKQALVKMFKNSELFDAIKRELIGRSSSPLTRTGRVSSSSPSKNRTQATMS